MVDLQLKGHRAIVTGSSASIGEAIARKLFVASPPEEVMRALDDQVRLGKVLYLHVWTVPLSGMATRR